MPCSVLVVDGLHSMHEEIMQYIKCSIFICTSDEQLMKIRHKADIIKRKQTSEFSKMNLDSELNKYKMFVDPYKSKANVVLTLTDQRHYELHVT